MYELVREEDAGRPTLCQQCSQPLAQSARFCGTCGTAIPVPEGDAVSPIPFPRFDTEPEPLSVEVEAMSRNPRRSTTARVLGALLGTALLAAGLLAWNDVQTHNNLTSANHQLTSAKSDLTRVGGDLSLTRARLTTTQEELDSTQADLDQATQNLTQLKQRLNGVTNSLSNAKSRLDSQSGQIETLKSCLNGVSLALRDVAYDDYTSAVSALDAVRVSCDAAYKMLN